jgi:hypothetical protein
MERERARERERERERRCCEISVEREMLVDKTVPKGILQFN